MYSFLFVVCTSSSVSARYPFYSFWAIVLGVERVFVLLLLTLLSRTDGTRNLARRCSGVLRLIQDFLGRPKDLVDDEVALSPALCDQKRAELLLYKLLNQVDSPAARLKVRITVHLKGGGAWHSCVVGPDCM